MERCRKMDNQNNNQKSINQKSLTDEQKAIKIINDEFREQKEFHISRNLPFYIIQNGFFPTFYFLKEKKKKEKKDGEAGKIIRILELWLKEKGLIKQEQENELKEILLSNNYIKKRRITMEALFIANLIKRIADIKF